MPMFHSLVSGSWHPVTREFCFFFRDLVQLKRKSSQSKIIKNSFFFLDKNDFFVAVKSIFVRSGFCSF